MGECWENGDRGGLTMTGRRRGTSASRREEKRGKGEALVLTEYYPPTEYSWDVYCNCFSRVEFWPKLGFIIIVGQSAVHRFKPLIFGGIST